MINPRRRSPPEQIDLFGRQPVRLIDQFSQPPLQFQRFSLVLLDGRGAIMVVSVVPAARLRSRSRYAPKGSPTVTSDETRL